LRCVHAFLAERFGGVTPYAAHVLGLVPFFIFRIDNNRLVGYFIIYCPAKHDMSRRPNPEVFQRLLIDGGRLVHKAGFHATGVQDIAAAAQIPKGSFYSYFDSKESFASAILQRYWADIENRLIPVLYDTSIAPLTRIKRFFDLLEKEHASNNFTIGCLIGNLSLELANSSDEVRATLAHILGQWETALAMCIKEAHRGSRASTQRDAHELAAIIIDSFEGAVLRSKIERTDNALQRFADTTLPRILE
jgi:TetR/AcrR family transcriptional repressor of nem operon